MEPGDDDSYELITYGCLPPAEKTRMQCNTPDHVHKKQLSMECCRNGDMCNTFLQPTLPTTPSPATGRGLSELLYILCTRLSSFAIVWVFILQNSWVHDYFGLSIITEFGLKRVLLMFPVCRACHTVHNFSVCTCSMVYGCQEELFWCNSYWDIILLFINDANYCRGAISYGDVLPWKIWKVRGSDSNKQSL